MKKALLLLAALVISFSVFAQSGPSGDSRDLRQRMENMKSGDSRNSRGDRSNDSQTTKSKGVTKTGLSQCRGEFAYCGSSTCKPTGKMIKVKEDGGKYTREYPEAVCTCPVITKQIACQNGSELTGFATLNEGNMNGSCNPPSKGTIWSYASATITMYPQESTNPPFQMKEAGIQTCPAGSGQTVNCWDFLCKRDGKKVNGVEVATCSCPIGESILGHPAKASDDFITGAGAYYSNPSQACAMYPVSFPIQ